MTEPRNTVVQVRRFGGPDGLEVIDAPLPTASSNLLERRHFEDTALVRVVTGSCERQVDLAAVCRGGNAV